ncbi:MAG: hypothetical protein Q8S31_05660 [Alphaproteobacteria bacterium]|nr:hypothetical protein [Alphaproteobacteria bacterium]
MIKHITQKNIHNFSNSVTEYFYQCPENQEITSVAGILEVSMDCYNTIFEKANSEKQSCVHNFLS